MHNRRRTAELEKERASGGQREGEWTAVAPTELEVVRSMAYCLREHREGRWPK